MMHYMDYCNEDANSFVLSHRKKFQDVVLKDEKLAEGLTTTGVAFHKLTAFRKYDLKCKFFLASGIWTFKLSRSKYGNKSFNIVKVRGCKVGDAIPNIVVN